MRSQPGVDTPPRLLADWQNADPQGCVRLNTSGALRQIERLGSSMQPGLSVVLDDGGEFEADGVVAWSADEAIWVAAINGLRDRADDARLSP
jgi:urease accessory protein UreE